jgi:hypothetical protein
LSKNNPLWGSGNVLKMATSGFVGYKENGIIKGYFNLINSQYNELGLKVLQKFNDHSKKELEHFFKNKLNFSTRIEIDVIFNQKYIWECDWLKQNITIKEDHHFLFDDMCCYGYVYNLDDDSLDLYRGLFKQPQTIKEQNELKIKKIFVDEEKKHFTHQVYSIKRNEIKKIEKLFLNWDSIEKIYKGPYQEKDFMEFAKK